MFLTDFSPYTAIILQDESHVTQMVMKWELWGQPVCFRMQHYPHSQSQALIGVLINKEWLYAPHLIRLFESL
jgi:hypothetical protein